MGAVGAVGGTGGVRSWGRVGPFGADWALFRAEVPGWVGAALAWGLGAESR